MALPEADWQPALSCTWHLALAVPADLRRRHLPKQLLTKFDFYVVVELFLAELCIRWLILKSKFLSMAASVPSLEIQVECSKAARALPSVRGRAWPSIDARLSHRKIQALSMYAVRHTKLWSCCDIIAFPLAHLDAALICFLPWRQSTVLDSFRDASQWRPCVTALTSL